MYTPIFRILLLVFVSLSVGACVAAGRNVAGDYRFTEGSDKGLLILSLRLVDKCGRVGGLTTSVDKHAPEKSAVGEALPIRNALLKPDFQDPFGYFYVREYSAGRYALRGAHATGFTLSARANHDDLFSFEIVPGKAIYIGEIEFTVHEGCRRLSIRASNQWQRDQALLRQRLPAMPAHAVFVRLAKSLGPREGFFSGYEPSP